MNIKFRLSENTQSLKKSSSCFGHLLSKCSKPEENCTNFFVLLRKSELYEALIFVWQVFQRNCQFRFRLKHRKRINFSIYSSEQLLYYTRQTAASVKNPFELLVIFYISALLDATMLLFIIGKVTTEFKRTDHLEKKSCIYITPTLKKIIKTLCKLLDLL